MFGLKEISKSEFILSDVRFGTNLRIETKL